MSKKNKPQAIEIPAAYALLEKPTKKTADRKVVIDTSGNLYVFPNKDSVIPPEVMPEKTWNNFDELLASQQQSVLAYHEQLIGPIPKKQDFTTTAQYLWAYFTKNGKPVLENTNAETGEKERKSSLSTRKYFVKTQDKGTLATRQAVVCFDILKDCCKEKGFCTEAELQASVERRKEEIKTRQDPWRIFQYYRPQLIKLGLIRYE